MLSLYLIYAELPLLSLSHVDICLWISFLLSQKDCSLIEQLEWSWWTMGTSHNSSLLEDDLRIGVLQIYCLSKAFPSFFPVWCIVCVTTKHLSPMIHTKCNFGLEPYSAYHIYGLLSRKFCLSLNNVIKTKIDKLKVIIPIVLLLVTMCIRNYLHHL